MKLKPIARRSLVDLVAERIRGLIDRGRLEAGDRLPGEMELVGQLQVSRPVLREAISRLESVGLVTVRRGHGMFVGDRGSLSNSVKLLHTALSISPKDIRRYAELRTAIEVHAARRAAELASADDLAELKTLFLEMNREDQEYLDAIRLDFQFHRKVVEIAGNEVMTNLMQVIHEFVMASMIHTTPNPRHRSRSRGASGDTLHGDILQAIRSGDPDAAEQAMKVHMNTVEKALREAEERRHA